MTTLQEHVETEAAAANAAVAAPGADLVCGCLLAVGVVACEGRFEPGDAVELVGPNGAVFGHGIVAAAPAEIASRTRGLEAVHRDRLVVF